MTNKIYRQGDVLITRVNDEVTEAYKPVNPDNGRVILAYGEVTGHAHALKSSLTEMYESNGDRLMKVRETADLNHEEHTTITFEPGTYRITQQKQYQPEAIRNVLD